MLSEATIQIKPSERKKLEEYVRNLSRFVNALFQPGMPIDANALCQELNAFSKRGMITPKLSVKFDFNGKRSANGEYHPDWESIKINLYRMVKARLIGPDKYAIVSVNYPLLISVLIHEFIHYKQDMKVRSKQYGRFLPFRQHVAGSSTYFKDPDERQAWAAQYLEYIKRQLNVNKPEEAIDFLRRMGVNLDPRLADLKDTDYASWKRIMRNAAMMALYNAKQKKTT